MPELPEVEIVCRNLAKMLQPGAVIRQWKFFRGDLRFKIPKTQLQKLQSLPLVRISRRAKYILFYFGDYVMISHLGMTGSWRLEKAAWDRRKHDHLAFAIDHETFLVFEDPRRFGFIEVVREDKLNDRFSQLGAEPLDSTTNFELLGEKFSRLSSPIKTALMNQKLLVGVGNIYASEVLFRTGIHPQIKCSKLSQKTLRMIFREVEEVLTAAISAGGSSISSYRNSYGEKGNFQTSFFVYGRKNEPCLKCSTPIKSSMQAGRSTFWCPRCQKK